MSCESVLFVSGIRNPASPDLSEFRVDHSGCAFQVTGLDFAGLLCKEQLEQSQGVHITRCASRAIHLKLTMDLSIEGFYTGSNVLLLVAGYQTS